MDLSAYSLDQLKAAMKYIPKEIEKRERTSKDKVHKELKALAEKNGFSLDDFLGPNAISPVKEKRTVAVKYRHPTDESLTWTGRGRQPLWVADFLATGESLDSLRV